MGTTDNKKQLSALRFHVKRGGQLIKSVEVAQDCIFVGRLLTTNLPIDDPMVSRMHCVIEVREGGQVLVTDLDSSNGTRVNGQDQKSAELKSGDVFEVGDSSIEVEFVENEDRDAFQPNVVYHSGAAAKGLGKQMAVDTVLLDSMEELRGDADLTDDDIDELVGTLESEGAPFMADGGPAEEKQPAKKGKKATKKGKAAPPQPAKRPAIPRAFLPRTEGTCLQMKVQWGEELLDTMHLDEPQTISIGTHKKNTFIIPAMLSDPPRVPIISPISEKNGGGFLLGFTDRMEGWFFTGDKLSSLEEIKKSPRTRVKQMGEGYVFFYPLTAADQGTISIENLAFAFQTVRAFPPYKSPKERVNKRPFYMASALYALLAILMFLIPTPDTESTVDEQVKETAKAVRISYDRKKAKSMLDKLAGRELMQTGSRKGRVKAKAAVGTNQKGDRVSKKVGGSEGKRGRAKGRKRKRRSSKALSQALGALQGNDIARVLNQIGAGGGLGSVSGGKTGRSSAPRLFAGLGSNLKGTSGGGKGFGGGESVDIGGLGTKGRGGGSGGYGTVRLGRKMEMVVSAETEGEASVRGGLDKALILRIIRRNIGQIRFCYESRLQVRRHALKSGKIKVQWRIAPSGRVVRTNVVESTINDAYMEQCVTGRIRTWKFPEPKGGGSVTVVYPFTFRPTG